MKFIPLFILLAAEAFAQTNSYIPPTRLLRYKGYQIGAQGESFVTSKRVDEDGKKEDLPDGQAFSRIQSELSGYYGATNDLQFGVGVRFRQNRFTFEDNNKKETSASSGIQSTFASIMFAFPMVDQLQYTLEGLFRYVPYSNDETKANANPSTDIILGDVGSEISAGLGVTYFGKNNNFLTFRGGARRPGSDLANEIYWQVEGAMAWKRIALIAGAEGVTSLKNDPYKDAPDERPIYNSGTNLYGSINREWVMPYAGINFAIGDTWRVELKGAQTVSGRSTDLGTTVGINLIKRVDVNAAKVLDNRFKTYDLEASITKLSPKGGYVMIDKGLADDITKGMKFDFFEFDYVGGNVLIATGVVVKTKSDSSIVKITQRYNTKKEIKEGLIGRTTLK